ncbi:hypothetical protein Tco_1082196 [Tanacetum coccineum]|uniref:Uncharacterized protein n=1 Tax=Tanacetum coccineum TaxID=301880 RepID=A0ABQ5HZQ0_9ASTR
MPKAHYSISSSSSGHHLGSSSHYDEDDEDEVPPPPPTQESGSMDITLTLSPITPLDIQFNTPSPSPPLFSHPIP